MVICKEERYGTIYDIYFKDFFDVRFIIITIYWFDGIQKILFCFRNVRLTVVNKFLLVFQVDK